MALATYKIPNGAAISPINRLGPPVFESAELAYVQGTNRDYSVWKFDPDVNESILFECPVSDSYVGGTRQVRIRWRAPATGGSVVWGVEHEPTGPGEQFDEVYTGSNTATTVVPGTLNDTVDTIITLSGNIWSAGDVAFFHLFRDATNGSDDHTGDVEILNIDVLQDLPGGSGSGILNGFTEEVFAASAFTFSAGVSTVSIAGTPDTNALLFSLRSLARNGLPETDQVAVAPSSAGEWRLNAGTTELDIYGDVTATGDEYILRYPTV